MEEHEVHVELDLRTRNDGKKQERIFIGEDE
jgi:hypothetical protein